MEGAKPLPRPPQRAKSPYDTKRSGREVQQPSGLLDRGEPYQGVPRRTQSCSTRLPNKNRAARRNDKRFDSLARFSYLLTFSIPKILRALSSVAAQPVARLIKLDAKKTAAAAWERRHAAAGAVFALDKLAVRHAAISLKLRPRGHPRAACGPPFFCFGLRPRRNGVGFRFLRKARKGLCPFHPHHLLKKVDENFAYATCQALPFTRPSQSSDRSADGTGKFRPTAPPGPRPGSGTRCRR